MSLTAIIFVGLFAAGLIASLVRHPAFGLYTYLATFYLHPPDRWWGAQLPDLRWSLLAALVTLLSLWRHTGVPDRLPLLAHGGLRAFLAFALWIWLQLAWALAPDLHLEAAVLFTKYAILILLIYHIIQDEQTLRHFLLAHVIGCFYLGWLILAAPESGRLDGIGGPGIDEANSLATQLGTGLLAASALILNGPRPLRLAALATMPFIANGIIQTLSRGAVLGLISGGMAMLYLTPGRYRRVYYALGVLGLLMLVQMAPTTFWERLGTISAPLERPEEVDMSTRTRLELIGAQWQMAIDYPFGSGHRGTAMLSPRYLGQEHLTFDPAAGDVIGSRSSHNTLMSVIAEHGIIGLIIWLSLLWWIWRSLLRLKALDASGLPETYGTCRAAIGGALTCVLVAGLFTDYLKSEVWVWSLALLAAFIDMTGRVSGTTAGDTPGTAGHGLAPRPAGRLRHAAQRVASSASPARRGACAVALLSLAVAGATQAGDFASRCAAPGVVKCVGFDDDGDFSRDFLNPAWDGRIRATRDTTIKASGESSLRFDIPSRSAANAAGYWLDRLGARFGPGSTLHVQFRQRFSKTMLETRFEPHGGWKQVILHGPYSSCASVELTTVNTYLAGFPRMYTDCGARPLEVPLPNGDLLLQQGDWRCHYRSINRRDCAFYAADEWMTFHYEIRLGEWNTPTSHIQAWVAYENKPLRRFIDIKDYALAEDRGPTDAYTMIQLTPYMTRKNAQQTHPEAQTWYDELIVSRQPIAAPAAIPR